MFLRFAPLTLNPSVGQVYLVFGQIGYILLRHARIEHQEQIEFRPFRGV